MALMSEACNLDCSYCGMDKWTQKKIDADKFINQFNGLRSKYPDEKIRVDFFGGEPLMQIRTIKKIVSSLSGDGNIKFTMPTNGLLLTENILQYLQDNEISTSISFDGLWQRGNRPFRDNKTKSSTTALMNKKHLFNGMTCHTMIGKGNYNILENHLWITNNFGMNPDLSLIRDNGTWDDPDDVMKLNKGISEIFEWWQENSHEEMPKFILFYLRHFILYHSKGVVIDGCGAGKNLFTVHASNDTVLPCDRFKDNPEMIAKMPEFYDMKTCRGCEVRNYCRKGCLFEQIKNNGPIEGLCNIYKYVYKEVVKMVEGMQGDTGFRNIIRQEIENELYGRS